ncbi:MAG TPA: hypothetical protein VNO81_05925 [Candidatus Nitrosotenuis sp.]|nr:hypothetical protein [Candidatus Nitrosotenuis sp.]
MPVALEYRYSPGEVLVYQQTVTMVVEEPGQEPLGGRAEFELTQRVAAEHGDSWTVEVSQRALQVEGILCQSMPASLTDRHFQVRMDRRGSLLDLQGGPPPGRVPAFPLDPVDVGDSWVVTEPSAATAPALEITYTVEDLEETGDDILAHLVSTSSLEQPQEGLSTEVQASTLFSVMGGCQLRSTTVIRQEYQGGAITQTVVENRLCQRQQASATGEFGVL